MEKAIAYHIELVDEETIDKINILNATKVGMMVCINELSVKPDIVLKSTAELDYNEIVEYFR